jgi:glycosyltransferase involved in cell wall biosynthesis
VGGGIIVKVLDAMAAATPVVTTSYGNEGIGAAPGRDLLVADSPEAFAAEVVKVLKGTELAESLSKNGREFVREHYSLASVMERIETAYQEMVRSEW